jgi:PAS domain S-box-containing protein
VARTLALGVEGRRLEESRSNLVEIFEATPDFVTMSPPDGSPQYVNAAARRALGIAEGDRIDSLLGYRKPEFQQQLLQTILPTARRDGTWRGETEYVSRSGQVIPVSQVSVAHKDVNGNVRMLSTISRDITDRLAEQVKLRDAEERLRFALEASGVGVWEVNMQTGVAYWSETCEAMHGLTRGTFAGSTGAFLSCIHEDDRKDVLNAVERAVRSQRDATLEYRTVWPDGRVRAISSTGRFVRDASGVPLRGAGIAMDITERRSLEAQLHQAQKMEAIGQLAGGIAHDFNNLTTAIIGYAGLLSDSLGSTDERRADVAEIERAAGRAADLTRQLLAFSRKQILQPRVLQLGRVVIELAPMLRRLLGEAIDLRTVIADRGSVKADPGQIEQVIVNIAVNARDAMPTGGRLTIETGDIAPEEPETNPRQDARDCPSVFLAISDTGHGMDRATLQRVFEPFFTTKPTGRGTGLGLATAHGIVTQSGGSIDVSSEVGQGTTFRIIFPRTEERPDRPAIEQVDQPVPRGTEVILLVEDEQAVREFVHRVLTHHGYRVHAFAEPSRAVAFGKAHQSTVDLVLTDVVLPEIDGRTMALEISKCHPEVTVLYMSGYAEAAIVEGGVLEPGLFFIEKPFTAEALLWKVRELLEQPRTRPIGMRATDGRSREAARRPAAPFTS